MNTRKQPLEELKITWKEEQRTLKLEGEPVLQYTLSWPEAEGNSRGARRLNRYYLRVARAWRGRWERELYWRACLCLAARREQSRPFRPWSAQAGGEVTYSDGELLSIRMDAREVWEDGRPLRVRTGDLWRLPDGVPCPLQDFFPGIRRWRGGLLNTLNQQGEVRRQAGDCFFDPGFAKELRRTLSPHRCCRTQQGLEFYVPQCVMAPAAEEIPVFRLELPENGAVEFGEKYANNKRYLKNGPLQ